MSGGTWTLENKIRPGAYVNFAAESYQNEVMVGSGVVTLPYFLSWYEEDTIVEVKGRDLRNGKCRELLGYSPNHEKSLTVVEALKNCSSVLVYPINSGGVKAVATVGALTVTAKKCGLRGNDILVGVEENGEKVTVVTYVDNKEAHRQTLATTAVPVENSWVSFSLNGTLSPSVPVSLSGGTDGTQSSDRYDAYLTAIKKRDWQVLALPKKDGALSLKILEFIRDLRENQGKKVQGVVVDYPCDYEGIINVTQGYVRDGVTVSAPDFTAWVAGATAGAEVYESNTYKVIADATAIVGEVTPSEIEDSLQKGIFLLSRRTDKAVVVEQDINSLTTFGVDKSRVFRKNRVIRCLDKIANGVANLFEVNYIGRVSNNAEGRDLFKQDIISFLRELMAVGAIENFNGAEDILVAEGKNVDSIVVSLAICPVDAMEKLYITVEVA